MSRVALYPGSFDPVTYGHIDLITRASRIFDKIIVAAAEDTQKRTLFTCAERVEMLTDVTRDIPNIEVVAFKGLVVDYAQDRGVNVLLRGLRMISDFEFELQMALTNRRLNEKIETLFLMPSEGHSFVSSTLLKEAASLGADTSSFVPPSVNQRLKDKLAEQQNSAVS